MNHLILQADARRIPLADRSVQLVIGSPPYVDARTYLEDGRDLGIARKCDAWIDWMLGVTAEALRVSQGLVLWVVAGKTADWNYQPAPEGLLYRWWAQGGDCHCFRPCYWHRVGIPGSGGKQWYRADVEYVLAFKRPGGLPFGNPTINGSLPKFAPGGAMSHRSTSGRRANADADGIKDDSRKGYKPPKLTNPGTVLTAEMEPDTADVSSFFHTNAGGGQLGSKLAHENEAPYPVGVPRFFINSHTQPGDTVLDPFNGSGSTGQASKEIGRNYIGLDLRTSQCKLSRRRLAGVTSGFRFDSVNVPA